MRQIGNLHNFFRYAIDRKTGNVYELSPDDRVSSDWKESPDVLFLRGDRRLSMAEIRARYARWLDQKATKEKLEQRSEKRTPSATPNETPAKKSDPKPETDLAREMEKSLREIGIEARVIFI